MIDWTTLLVTAAVATSPAPAAPPPHAHAAAEPGTWVQTTQLFKPAYYRQGLASNPKTGDVFFSGTSAGIYRTHNGKEIKANTLPIPKDVADRELYNHIGDISFDTAEGGRLLLPLESYQPFQADTNPSKTGSVGVMDPTTLQWKYYVKLDPSEIAKAQLFATDPAQGLLWTITGNDLLAYRLSDVNPGNAAPDAAPIHSVRRLADVVPQGTGGAVVLGGRIYFSSSAGNIERVVSVDENTGASRTEIELPGNLEAEGMDVGPYYGGLLHWELVPGVSAAQLYSFVPKGSRLRLRLAHARIKAGKKQSVKATVTVRAGGQSFPLPGVQLRLAGKKAMTNPAGSATVTVKLTRGSYRAQAFFKGLRTVTTTVRAT